MSYDLSDYVDVAERIRLFKEKYPEGFLRGDGEFIRNAAGEIIGYVYRAEAIANTKTGDVPVIGVGTAYEPIPGATPYTRNSEVMNAETSAWGRAIVALGFETKHIASANEVRNRSAGGNGAASLPQTTPAAPSAPVESSGEGSGGGSVWKYGKKYGGTPIAQVPGDYLKWVVEESSMGQDAKGMASAELAFRSEGAGGVASMGGGGGDADIPFA